MTEQAEPSRTAEQHELSAKLDSVGWALFFIWVGIVFLADVGWGWGLLGIGVIILGGLWELIKVPWPLVPILLILCGLVVLWGAISGKHVMKK